MYLQTKKVVIIYIVTIITFVSIISTLYQDAQDTIPQISVISSEELSYKVSFAQSAYNELSLAGDDSSEFAMYGASIYQIAQKSSAQMNSIVNGSDTTIIIGDTFNEFISQMITENETKQFVLIENSQIFDYDNVYQININYSGIYDAINRLSKEQKSVVYVTDKFSELAENQYLNHDIAANGNVKIEVINNSVDQVGVKAMLQQDLEDGFTNVYSLDPYNNAIIIEEVNNFNETLIEKQSEAKLSEVGSENSEEVQSEVIADEPVVKAQLKYLTLNQVDFESQDANSNIKKYEYDVSANMEDVTKATQSEHLLSKNELISITNKK